MNSLKNPLPYRSLDILWYAGLITSAVLLFIALKLAIFNVGIDYQQGEIFKFLYIHVPCAWFSLILLFFSASSQLALGFYPSKFLSLLLQTCLSVGMLCAFVVMATGYYWGSKIWGGVVFSDPRIFAQIVVSFVYILFVLFNLADTKGVTYKLISFFLGGLSLIAIIQSHFSVYWYSSIHQLPSVVRPDGDITIDVTMRMPLWWSTAFLLVFVLTVFIGLSRSQHQVVWVQKWLGVGV